MRKLLLIFLIGLYTFALATVSLGQVPGMFQPLLIASSGGPIGTPSSMGTAGLSDSGTSSTYNTNAAATAGNLLVFCAAANTTNSVSITAVATPGNTFTKVTSVKSPDTISEGSVWYKENANAESSGVAISITYASAAGPSTQVFSLAQVSGIIGSGSLDKFASQGVGSGSPSASTGTLSQANEIIFGCGVSVGAGGAEITPAPFTTVTSGKISSSTTQLGFDYDKVAVTTTVTYTPTWSGGAGSRNTGIIASFKGN